MSKRGEHTSVETRIKMRDSRLQWLKRNGVGKETRIKMSENAKSQWSRLKSDESRFKQVVENSKSAWTDEMRKSAAERAKGNTNRRGKSASIQTRMKISDANKKLMAQRGGAGFFKGRTHSEISKSVMAKRRIEYLKKGIHGKTHTSIERKVAEQLSTYGVRFVHQYSLKNKFVVDFYIPDLKLLVECDGDYWHSRADSIERDLRKDELAMALGFGMLHLRERVINRSDFDIGKLLAI